MNYFHPMKELTISRIALYVMFFVIIVLVLIFILLLMFKNIVDSAYWCYGKSQKIFDYLSGRENERRFEELEKKWDKKFEEWDKRFEERDKKIKQLQEEQKELKLSNDHFFKKHAIWQKEREIDNKTFNASLALQSQKRRIESELENIKSYRELGIEHKYELKVTYNDEDGNPVEETYDHESAEEFLRKNLEEFNQNIERLESFKLEFKEKTEKERNDLEQEYKNNLDGLSSDGSEISDNEENDIKRDRKPSASLSECSMGDNGGMMEVE